MKFKEFNSSSFFVTAAAFVIVIAGIRAAEAIIVPFLVAIFLAVISAPPVFWLERKGVPAVLSVLLVVSGVLGIAIGVAMLLGSTVDDFYRAVPEYQRRLREELAPLVAWLGRFGIDVSRSVIYDTIDPGAMIRLIARTLSNLGGVLSNAFLILLTLVFILLEASSFPIKLYAVLDDPQKSLSNIGKILTDVKRYLALKSWVSLATGVLVALWLTLLDIDFPMVWGIVAFLLNFVPNLGSIIAAVPVVVLGFIQYGVGTALLVASGYIAINVVFGNVVEPRLMGRRLGLSTLVVFLSLVFWGWVLGPVGMLLSIPLTMTVKIALESNDNSRWIAVLLGPEVLGKTMLPPAQMAADESDSVQKKRL